MFRKIPFSLLFIVPFIIGCTPMTEIHNYAASSVDALNKIDRLDYSFNDYCRQDCELRQLRIGEIRPTFTCNCSEAAANADEAIQKIRQTITAYLHAVAQ